MWDLIVSVPDHCLSFYFNRYKQKGPGVSFIKIKQIVNYTKKIYTKFVNLTVTFICLMLMVLCCFS